MGKMYNIKKIDFKTKRNPSDIIEIAKSYIEHQDEIYEIDENSIVCHKKTCMVYSCDFTKDERNMD